MTKQITWEEFTNKVSTIIYHVMEIYGYPYDKPAPCLSEITFSDNEVLVSSHHPSFYLHFKKNKTLLLSKNKKSIKLRENISYDEMLDILNLLAGDWPND